MKNFEYHCNQSGVPSSLEIATKSSMNLKKILPILSLFIGLFAWSKTEAQCTISYSTKKVCLGDPVSFFAQFNGVGQSYLWDFDNGDTSKQSSPTYTYGAPGIYYPKFTVTLNGGQTCNITGDPITVYDLPKPGFVLISSLDTQCFRNNYFCIKDTSKPGASGAPINNIVISWGDGSKDSSGSSGVGSNFCHKYPAGGTYTIVMVVTDANGCDNRIEIKNILTVQDPLGLSFSTDNNIQCDTTCVKFDNTSSSPISNVDWFAWDFGDGTTYQSSKPATQADFQQYWKKFQHCYTIDGRFTSKIIVASKFGCVDTFLNNSSGANIVVTFDPIPKDTQCFKYGGVPNVYSFSQTPVTGAKIYWYWGHPPPKAVDSLNWNPKHSFPGCKFGYTVTRVIKTPYCTRTQKDTVNIWGPTAKIEDPASGILIEDTLRHQCDPKDTVVFTNASQYCPPNVPCAGDTTQMCPDSNYWKRIVRIWDFDDQDNPRTIKDTEDTRNGFPCPTCNWSRDSLPKHKYADTLAWKKIYITSTRYYMRRVERNCQADTMVIVKLVGPDTLRVDSSNRYERCRTVKLSLKDTVSGCEDINQVSLSITNPKNTLRSSRVQSTGAQVDTGFYIKDSSFVNNKWVYSYDTAIRFLYYPDTAGLFGDPLAPLTYEEYLRDNYDTSGLIVLGEGGLCIGPMPPYGITFKWGNTSPGCTQQYVSINFDSACCKAPNDPKCWTKQDEFAVPPWSPFPPWPSQYKLPYFSTCDTSGWVTVGLVIFNGMHTVDGNKTVDFDKSTAGYTCADTMMLHNTIYLDTCYKCRSPKYKNATYSDVCISRPSYDLADYGYDQKLYDKAWNIWIHYVGDTTKNNPDSICYTSMRYDTLEFMRNTCSKGNFCVDTTWYHHKFKLKENNPNFTDDMGTPDYRCPYSFIMFTMADSSQPISDIAWRWNDMAGAGITVDSITVDSIFRQVPIYKTDTCGGKLVKKIIGYTPFKRMRYFFQNGVVVDSLNLTKGDTTDTYKLKKYFAWKLGPDDLPTMTHFFPKRGLYVIGVTMHNTDGCERFFGKEEVIGNRLDFYSSDTLICKGQTVDFTSDLHYWLKNTQPPQPNYDTTSYWCDPTVGGTRTVKPPYQEEKMLWNFADKVNPTSRACNPSHTFSDSGVYTVQLFTEDSNYCKDTLKQNIYVTAVKAKFTTASGDSQYYCSQFIQFKDLSWVLDPCQVRFGTPCDYITDWLWDFGDGKTPSVLQNPIHDYTSNGTFRVRLTVTNKFGCTDTFSKLIYIIGPKPSFKIIGDTAGCAPFTVLIDNTSDTATKDFTFYWGDGQTYNTNKDTNVTHTYYKEGVYELLMLGTGSVRDANGTLLTCSNLYPDTTVPNYLKVTVKVNNTPPPNFTLDKTIICVGDSVTVTDASPTKQYNRFVWNFGDATANDTFWVDSPQTSVKHAYSKTGTYDIRFSPQYTIPPFCFADTVKQVTVVDIKADFDIDSSQVPLFSFTDKSKTGAPANIIKWAWDFGDHNTSTDQNPTHDYGNDTGSFNVCLKVTNDQGCTDSTCKIVSNKFDVYVKIPNVFTPQNNDGSNDTYDIDILGETDDGYHLTIFNRWGEKVFESFKDDENWNGLKMNTGAPCPSGTYYFVFDFKLRAYRQPKPEDVGAGIKVEKLNDKEGSAHGTITLIR